MKHKLLIYSLVATIAFFMAMLVITPKATSSSSGEVMPAPAHMSVQGVEFSGSILRGRVVPAQAKLFVELLSIPADGRVLDVTRTDENGWYSFAPLASGVYQLRVLDQDKQELVLAAGGQIEASESNREVEHTLELAFSASGDVMRQNERERAEATSISIFDSSSNLKRTGGSEGYITGQVTAADTGEPISSMLVQAYGQYDQNFAYDNQYTNSSGLYTLTLPAGTSYRVHFKPNRSSGYAPEWYNNQSSHATANSIEVQEGATITQINAELEVGGQITGAVTALDGGAPIEGVYVRAYDRQDNTESVAYGLTDENGVYVVPGLAAGSYYLKFDAPSDSGYADEYYNDKFTLAEANAITVGQAETVSDINATLETGGTIKGTVTAALDGTALENVSVSVYLGSSNDYVASAWTDANGAYEIPGLPGGSYYVKFGPPYNSGYVDEYYNNKFTQAEADPITVEFGSTVSDINAALETGGTINGTVTAVVDGTPIEDLYVTVYADTTSTSSVPSGYTQADGTYEIVGLPAGNYYLQFRAPYNSGYVDEYYNNKSTLAEADPVSVQLNTVQTIDAALETGGTISGVVTAQADGRVIENVGISIYTDTTSIRAIEYASTDESGAYELTGLPAGNYYVKFEAPYNSIYMDEYYNGASTLATADPVNVPANTVVSVDAALGIAGVVVGRVTAADTGLPLEDVAVSLYDRQCAEQEYNTGLDYASTDASGVYTLTVETTGSYDLLFEPYSNGPARAYFDTRNDGVAVTVGNVSESDAVLQRGGEIMGQVTAADSGEPLADVSVTVYKYDADNDYYDYQGSVRTNASGVYSSMALTTDNYRLRFGPASGGASGAYLREYYNDQASIENANEVSVTTGDITSDINAVLALGGQITGRVTAEDSGDPLEYVNVQVYDADGNYMGSDQTDRNGVYSTSGVPTGNYRLRFETPYWHENSADYITEYYNNQTTVENGDSVAVTAGSTTTDIDADLSRGGSIMGKVTAEDTGTPLSSVFVAAYDSNRNQVAYSFSDSNGEYDLRGLPPGSHIVYFGGTDQIVDCLRVEYDDIYYNQTQDFASANPVSLSGTETVENINAVLSRNNGQPPSDTTAPTLTMPDNMRVEAPDANGVVVEFTVTASDNSDPNPTVVCTPASGSTFPVGSTTVTCTATDASANQASRSFTISVIDSSVPPDTTAPTMAMPDEMTIAATSSSGAVVNYQVTASDDTDPNPAVVCTPPSGSTFPMGTTTVTCTVTDASGNQGSDSFTITVVEAGYQIHLPLVIRP